MFVWSIEKILTIDWLRTMEIGKDECVKIMILLTRGVPHTF